LVGEGDGIKSGDIWEISGSIEIYTPSRSLISHVANNIVSRDFVMHCVTI
jgi:hypothetical protein